MKNVLKNPLQYICVNDGLKNQDPGVEVLNQVYSCYEKMFGKAAPWEKRVDI